MNSEQRRHISERIRTRGSLFLSTRGKSATLETRTTWRSSVSGKRSRQLCCSLAATPRSRLLSHLSQSNRLNQSKHYEPYSVP
jgi:hypothetical protein